MNVVNIKKRALQRPKYSQKKSGENKKFYVDFEGYILGRIISAVVFDLRRCRSNKKVCYIPQCIKLKIRKNVCLVVPIKRIGKHWIDYVSGFIARRDQIGCLRLNSINYDCAVDLILI